MVLEIYSQTFELISLRARISFYNIDQHCGKFYIDVCLIGFILQKDNSPSSD